MKRFLVFTPQKMDGKFFTKCLRRWNDRRLTLWFNSEAWARHINGMSSSVISIALTIFQQFLYTELFPLLSIILSFVLFFQILFETCPIFLFFNFFLFCLFLMPTKVIKCDEAKTLTALFSKIHTSKDATDWQPGGKYRQTVSVIPQYLFQAIFCLDSVGLRN